MKKIISTTAMLAFMALAATSCQKENIDSSFNDENVQSINQMYYSIDGMTWPFTLLNDDDWDLFLNNMFALAKEGYTVTIRGNKESSHSEKKTVTFTTTSEDEAKTWVKDMLGQGYSVSMDYDKTTGIYTCIATK